MTALSRNPTVVQGIPVSRDPSQIRDCVRTPPSLSLTRNNGAWQLILTPVIGYPVIEEPSSLLQAMRAQPDLYLPPELSRRQALKQLQSLMKAIDQVAYQQFCAQFVRDCAEARHNSLGIPNPYSLKEITHGKYHLRNNGSESCPTTYLSSISLEESVRSITALYKEHLAERGACSDALTKLCSSYGQLREDKRSFLDRIFGDSQEHFIHKAQKEIRGY